MFRAATLGVVLAMLFAFPATAAVVVGQADTFEDGTTQGWVVNILGMGVHPAPPLNVADGGPAGAGDNYLLLSSVGGMGAGSRLVAINLAQWAGDYTGAGVTGISMAVNNMGATDLHLRLFFEDPMGGPPMNGAFSTNAIVIPAGSGWTNVIFPITAADLTAAFGSIDQVLALTAALRIYHSVAATFPGAMPGPETLIASLGVDNITAIPLPAALGLFAVGLSAFGVLRAGRRQKHSH